MIRSPARDCRHVQGRGSGLNSILVRRNSPYYNRRQPQAQCTATLFGYTEGKGMDDNFSPDSTHTFKRVEVYTDLLVLHGALGMTVRRMSDFLNQVANDFMAIQTAT